MSVSAEHTALHILSTNDC